MEAGEIKVKVSCSYDAAFAYVRAVDIIVKKHQDIFAKAITDEDAATIENAMEELRKGIKIENE
jgi:hypothetical protein